MPSQMASARLRALSLTCPFLVGQTSRYDHASAIDAAAQSLPRALGAAPPAQSFPYQRRRSRAASRCMSAALSDFQGVEQRWKTIANASARSCAAKWPGEIKLSASLIHQVCRRWMKAMPASTTSMSASVGRCDSST